MLHLFLQCQEQVKVSGVAEFGWSCDGGGGTEDNECDAGVGQCSGIVLTESEDTESQCVSGILWVENNLLP